MSRCVKTNRLTVKNEENFEPVNHWWTKEAHADGRQWSYLEHHGIIFSPPYEPHRIPMKYTGHVVELPPEAEEVVNYWIGAQNSEYSQKSKYINNFWSALLKRLPSDHPIVTGVLVDKPVDCVSADQSVNAVSQNPELVGDPDQQLQSDIQQEPQLHPPQSEPATSKESVDGRQSKISSKVGNEQKSNMVSRKRKKPCASLEQCDFSAIAKYLEDQKEKRASRTKEEKLSAKDIQQAVEGPYQYCLFDWLREKVGNIKMEPPNLFRGRGEHPKMGRLKRRVFPEEVTINLSVDAPVPRIPDDLKGHCWGDVYHDNHVCWLAYFRDNVNNQYKYMQLAGGSVVKSKSDNRKYEKSRQLKGCIDTIREDYQKKMLSSDMTERQLGTATYLIDALALRVGNEKDTTEMADTVGCCSLRVEHATCNDETCELTLDFLGKDSIRYFNTVKIREDAYANVVSFCKGKSQDFLIFDLISTTQLNKYLKELMPSLSAKVFRTYNASMTLQQELDKIDVKDTDISNADDVIRFYNDANRQVAILCNHQRTIPKQHDASMEKLQKLLEILSEDIRELEAFLKHLRSGTSKPFKFESVIKLEDGRKSVVKETMKEQQVQNKLKSLINRKATQELRMRVKDDNKTVSNTTSKQHYMDPRISIAFCKRFDIPIEKVFNKSLQKNFTWAMYMPSTFSF